MNSLDALVEQHVKEWELRLRKADELVELARPIAATVAAPEAVKTLLERVEADRAALRGAMAELTGAPSHQHAAVLERGKGPTSRLATLGEELEKALTAIGDRRGL